MGIGKLIAGRSARLAKAVKSAWFAGTGSPKAKAVCGAVGMRMKSGSSAALSASIWA